MSDVLTIDNLSKSFGRKKVLQGLNLSLQKGQVCGLLGRNAEGKTTLIRILMGIIPADGGRIAYQGRPIAYGSWKYKRTIGYIAEDSIFYSRMRVGELLRFNAAFYPAWRTERAEGYLHRLSLRAKDRIGNLSRGQKLKLGFVVALAAAPELLLLDDPTSGLDVPTRHDFLREIIDEIVAAGTTILFASHLVHELEKVVDRVAILHGGRTILDENLADLKSRIKRVGLRARPEKLEKIAVKGVLSRAMTGPRCELVIYPWDEKKRKQLAAASQIPLTIRGLSLEEIFTSFVS